VPHGETPERVAEVTVVGGVDERIDERVGVAEPRQEASQCVADHTRRTKRLDDVQYEERQPTDDETTHDDG